MYSSIIEMKLAEALTGKDLQGKEIKKDFSNRWEEYINILRKFDKSTK